jgi:hypothetical protein
MRIPRYEPAPGARIVQTDRGWPLHERYVAIFESDDAPTLECSVRLVDGRPLVERLTLSRSEPPGVTAGDVARLNLRDLFERVAGDTRIVDLGDYGAAPASGYGSATLVGLRRRRNEITPDRLRDVALVYRELWSDDVPRTEAMRTIAAALGISASQAYRLTTRARTEVDPATGSPYLTGDGP